MVELQETNMFADEELFGQYLTWTSEAIADMKALYAIVESQDGTAAVDVSAQLYSLAHNIKGMGTSFNFILMTEIGSSFCGYLKSFDGSQTLSKTILNAHIRALEVVLENRIVGDGGAKGTALLNRLKAIIDQELK